MSEPKKLSWSEFLAEFDASVHEAIVNARKRPGVDGLAMMVCHVLDSSRIGQKTAMVYGPECTFKSVAMITDRKAGIYITGLPSSASFAEAYTIDLPDGL